jgi:hypothetical protein
MVEDENDSDLDYYDSIEVVEATITIVDVEKQMLMSEHKVDKCYVDFGTSKHVTSNSILLHDIIETHSSFSVRLVK